MYCYVEFTVMAVLPLFWHHPRSLVTGLRVRAPWTHANYRYDDIIILRFLRE